MSAPAAAQGIPDPGLPPLRYDPLAPDVVEDPYPWYRRLVREARVYHDERNDLWVLSGYDDVHAATRDHEVYSSAEGVAYRRMWLPMMITLDPPDHTRLRRIVSREFTPRGLESWRPTVDRLAAEAVARFVDAGPTADFAATVASPFPVAVIAALLGVPDGDLPMLRRISDDVIEGFKLGQERSAVASRLIDLLSNRVLIEGATSIGMRYPSVMRGFLAVVSGVARTFEGEGRWANDVERSPRAVSDLQAYTVELVERPRREPGRDLVSQLIAAHPDGRLSQAEIFWFFLLLLIAGHETTTNLLGNLVVALLDRPQAWDRLEQDRSLVPSAINEALRFESPIQGFFRTATRTHRVGDAEIPAGARVLLLFGAANRDPEHYDDPDEFDVERDPRDHLGFGGGIHYCLGAALAEMEGQAILRELLGRVGRLELAGAIQRTRNPTLRGVKQLPLRIWS